MIRTEMRNPRTTHIDRMTTEEMVSLIAKENYAVVKAVEEQTTAIAAAVDAVSNSFSNGGRLFFIGAGTSGRLGVLDAAECPPIGRGTALTSVWNGAPVSFRGVLTNAAISTQALSRNLQAAFGVSNGSGIADYGRTETTNPVPVTLSFSIGTTKTGRTENPTMWVSLKRSRTVSYTPWRAIPAIAAEKITTP